MFVFVYAFSIQIRAFAFYSVCAWLVINLLLLSWFVIFSFSCLFFGVLFSHGLCLNTVNEIRKYLRAFPFVKTLNVKYCWNELNEIWCEYCEGIYFMRKLWAYIWLLVVVNRFDHSHSCIHIVESILPSDSF